MTTPAPSRTQRYACVAVLHALSCVGGGDGESGLHDLPPISWRGEYIEFGTDVAEEICPATLPAMNEYMEGVSEYVRSDTIFPVRYYRLSDDLTHHGFGCPEQSYGCIGHDDGTTVVGSKLLSHRHELIHASSSVSEHRLLEEGLSVYLGTDLQWSGIAEPLDIRAAFASVEDNEGALPAVHYPVAGHFISFLVDEYGLSSVVSLVQASAPGMTLAELAEPSIEHIGHDLRLDVDAFEASGPGCEVAQFSPMWFECELTPPSIPIFACAAGDDRIRVDLSLSCADGASGVQDGMVWKDILIDAPAPALALIYIYEGHPVDFVVRGCGGGCSTPFARLSSEAPGEGLILEAFDITEGLNLIRVSKPVEAQGPVRFSIAVPCP